MERPRKLKENLVCVHTKLFIFVLITMIKSI